MKLSELTTDRAFDVICEITPAVDDIICDEELIAEIMKKIEKKEGMNKMDIVRLAAEKVSKIIPIILKKKRASVYTIIAALNMTDIETVAEQNIIKTMEQIKDAFRDKDIVDFVKSCWKTEKSAS